MATIVSSQIVADRAQADGRRYVTERHTDSEGATHDVTYLAESDGDAQATANARQATILAQLNRHEISANMAKALNAELQYSFKYSTFGENAAELRQLFLVATKWELLTLGWVINELSLSDNQLKTIFEVDDAGLIPVKAKLVLIAGRYEDAIAEAGI